MKLPKHLVMIAVIPVLALAMVPSACKKEECEPAKYDERCEESNHYVCGEGQQGGHQERVDYCPLGCCGKTCCAPPVTDAANDGTTSDPDATTGDAASDASNDVVDVGDATDATDAAAD